MSVLISLVIPIFNESKTIAELVSTIGSQVYQPEEVILVDGGSTDNTLQILNEMTINKQQLRIISVKKAMPGKGRNIGSAQAACEWIAYTDAGIKLDQHWLEQLVKRSEEIPEADIIYGNFSPQINSFFDKCAAISYVPALLPGRIRTKSIASCLLKKEVWEKTGGFPDWRATEDLVFIEKAERMGYKSVEAPEAMVYWQLRPDLGSTFQKFDLYSTYNVWAGRQAYWHYGIARQYGLMLIFLLLGFFHSWFWLLLLPAWMVARVVKRNWSHRYEYGTKPLFNPAVFFTVMLITLLIDVATFSGWLKALLKKQETGKFPMAK